MAGKRRRVMSTSKGLRIATISSSGLTSSHSTLADVRRDRLRMESEKQARSQALTRSMRETIAAAALEVGVNGHHDEIPLVLDNDASEWIDVEDGDVPSTDLDGDNELLDEAFMSAINGSGISRSVHRDQPSRLQRNRQAQADWAAQLPVLVNTYLEWKHRAQPVLETPPDDGRVHFFEVRQIGLREYTDKYRVWQPLVEEDASSSSEEANVSLIKRGLLGCSPRMPTTAITLETLEIYHQLRRRQSSFSVQAMAKVICALHGINYVPSLRDQLVSAFDVYLDILRHVRRRVDQALGRNSPEWYLKHACPACSYKARSIITIPVFLLTLWLQLDDDPPLVPARLQAADGNMSLKRIDSAGHADERAFVSRYLIPPNSVEVFKDDVRGHRKAPAVLPRPSSNNPGTLPAIVSCTENWTVANTFKEETTSIFMQTGVYICACRHGIVQSLVEMRRSGELAKYGLATINKMLDVFGADQVIGSDIACSFRATVSSSSLGPKAAAHNLRLVVNAFHGHAHNRLCQLKNHPVYSVGMGLEDLETCERVFASSNAAARLVRHASYFHWLQFIDLHYDQWDQDKYLELSKFIVNNYKQALGIIADYTPELDEFSKVFGYSAADFKSWQAEELAYLESLTHEPEEDMLAMSYIEALVDLERAERGYSVVISVPFLAGGFPGSQATQRDLQKSARAIEVERKAAHRRLALAMHVADDLERRMGLEKRWEKTDPAYQEAHDRLQHREFTQVVDRLEGLVVQRLFELSKANLAATGYKMRKHISKSITRRSSTIRTALEKYNQLAPMQSPARPVLQYSEIITYATLGDFTLLKHSSHKIINKPWSMPLNREMALKYFKVIRAREEIVRLNVEARRLNAWADTEDQHLSSAAAGLRDTDPLISAEILRSFAAHRQANSLHRLRLQKLYKLKGYTGPGLYSPPSTDERYQDADDDTYPAPDDDDATCDEMLRLGDCLQGMS